MAETVQLGVATLTPSFSDLERQMRFQVNRNSEMLDLGQFDLGQSGFIRLGPVPDLGQFDLGQFELGQFDLGQFLVAQKFLHDLGQF